MLGQHPQMYGLPEMQFFMSDTIENFWAACLQASLPLGDGLVRVAAELFFGGQTEETVEQAEGWVRRRFPMTTGRMLEVLAEAVAPRILVEKSPSNAYNRIFLQRIGAMFPDGLYIHLVRHPRGQAESVLRAIEKIRDFGVGPMQWLIDYATYPTIEPNQLPDARNRAQVPELDPQKAWYVLNQNIRTFLRCVPQSRKLLIRSEDVVANPDEALRGIVTWLGIRADAEAIEEVKHPERSPYARLGPKGAMFGNDPFFLRDPAPRPARAMPQSLEGPLGWRKDGSGFLPEIKKLAAEFGYS